MRKPRRSASVAIALMAMLGLMAGRDGVAGAQAPGLPRTSDGKPNLSGIWQALHTAAFDLQDHGAERGVPAGQGVVEGNEIPYQTWALAKKRENFANRATADPETQCFQPGVPRITYMPFPFQIFQTSKLVTLVYEYAHATRIVYTDGTRHPDGSFGLWNGDSRGRWEGDTLIVDVADFNDRTWFDRAGDFHSDALHVVERYTLMDSDHIRYEATIEDPKVFTRPWKMSLPLYRRKDPHIQLLEFECHTFDLWPDQ